MERLKNGLGLLGGTFDPPHYGHLLLAQEAAYQLQLERVLFLPAHQNPLKLGEPITPPQARCAMVALAIRGNPRFELSRLDLDRPAPSFTVDLLRLVRDEVGEEKPLAFLGGADLLPELPDWYAADEILQLAALVVATRPGQEAPDLAALERRIPGLGARLASLSIPGVAISSTEIRARVARGQPITYLTPPAVERYIRLHGLYRADDGRGAPDRRTASHGRVQSIAPASGS